MKVLGIFTIIKDAMNAENNNRAFWVLHIANIHDASLHHGVTRTLQTCTNAKSVAPRLVRIRGQSVIQVVRFKLGLTFFMFHLKRINIKKKWLFGKRWCWNILSVHVGRHTHSAYGQLLNTLYNWKFLVLCPKRLLNTKKRSATEASAHHWYWQTCSESDFCGHSSHSTTISRTLPPAIVLRLQLSIEADKSKP